jgi:CBS domain-containing protein
MQSNPNLDEIHVRDIMQREVVTISREATVKELAELLAYHGVTGLPVLDPQEQVVGVASASDIVHLAAEHGESPMWFTRENADEPRFSGYFTPERVSLAFLHRVAENILDGYRVEDIMMPATFAVHEGTTVPELARFLLRAGVHRALVLEHGSLLGIATLTDIARAVAGEPRPSPTVGVVAEL